MIVTRLRVHPFGFFTDRQLEFRPGLNVVLGPNEAGKSTIFGAIKSSLLRTRLTRRQVAQHVGRYMPAGGGDIARLELEFRTAEGTWLLSRQWGASAASQLRLPSGGVLADEDAVSRALQEALPARQGTFWKVLMTGQAELAETIDSLARGSRGEVSDLTDMLRRTVLETAGIPVSSFRALVAERLRRAFLRWDRQKGGPEGSRGIENPWKKDVGEILAAWYAREELRARRAAALKSEAAVDDLNRRLREVSAAAAAADAFLSANRAAAEDARERRRLDAERTAVELELEKLRRANRDWPAAAARAEQIRRSIAGLEAGGAPLEAEGRAARASEEGRALREKHARVLTLVSRLEQERARARSAPQIERRAVEEIRKAAAEAAALESALDACRLTAVITGRKAAQIEVQEDLNAEKKLRLSPRENVHLAAGGRLRITHPDMEIEVLSTEAGAVTAAEKEHTARRALAQLLEAAGVRSVEEAEERARSLEDIRAAVRAAEKNLADELGGESAEQLAARAAALTGDAPARPWADVNAELTRVSVQLEAHTRELEGIEERLEEWNAAWGTPAALLERLADALAREKDIAQRIDACAPLPAGFSDSAAFLAAYEKTRDEARRLSDERARLADAKRELERGAPEQSSEELAGPLKDAEAAFETVLRRGRALERIGHAADALLAESDSAVYTGMQAELDPLISTMSLGRHTRVVMDGSLPRGLADAAGRSLPWELLSGGTRDTLALALRLAMAGFFLKNTDGFLMLDDPLVEMDPGRQEAAAAALASFAAHKQLIIFTCHPAAAQLLGGNLIEL